MVAALFLSTEIIACETVRNAHGLALSSRNGRLNEGELDKATQFATLLRSSLSDEEVTAELIRLGFKVDYIVKKWQRRLGAVYVGDVRLIDNIRENLC